MSEEKWSGRKTLAFIVVFCGSFWLLVAWLIKSIGA